MPMNAHSEIEAPASFVIQPDTMSLRLPARLFLVFILPLLVLSCSNGKKTPESRIEFLLGTTCGVTIHDNPSTKTLDKVFRRIKEIEERMSVNLESSEVSAINGNAGKSPVAVSEETYKVVATALKFAALSGGAFDPSIGPVVGLWGIGTERARLPKPEEIAAALKAVDYRKVKLSEADRSVFLTEAGMALDLGAIAKGWAADEAARVLRENGVGKAIIDLGGNIFVLGSHPGNRPWRIGVQNPDKSRGKYIGIVQAEDLAVVTSGIYERFFIGSDGRRYHHILDTKNGYPVSNGLTSVTVIARDSTSADALSTALFSLGLERGLALAESLDGVEAAFITEGDVVHVTKGLKDVFEMTDETFRLAPTE